MRSYSRRLMDSLEVGIAAVWHGERLPDLDKLLSKRKKSAASPDRAFTAAESRKWSKFYSEQAAR